MALGVGDIVRTSVNFTMPGNILYQNIYHHIFDGTGGVSDAAVVADIKAWADAMYSQIDEDISQSATEQLSSVDRVDWSGTEWEVVENIGVFTPEVTQAEAGHMSANQVSMFITFKTDRPKSVGRKFLFPTPEAHQAAGVIDGDLLARLVNFADDAVNDITIDVLNVLHPGIVRTGVNQFLLFQVAIVTDLVGTQRRRRPGYGA